MSDDSRYGGAHLLIAFLAGAAAGAAVAFLTAPRSGRETRAKVRAWAQDVGDKATRFPGAMKDAYGRAAGAAKEAFAEALREDAPDSDA